MSKLKVYIVHRCSDVNESERIIGIYLSKEAAQIKVKRLQDDDKDSYYAIIKKSLQGDYWLGASGLMFINLRFKKAEENTNA